jgi:hypothetical protein
MSTNGVQTSVVGASPEITAPVRLEGQTDPDVLFDWLVVNRYLWVLEPPYEEEVERIVKKPRRRLRLVYLLTLWRKEPGHTERHAALAAPGDDDARRAAFARLKRVVDIHLFDTGGSDHD